MNTRARLLAIPALALAGVSTRITSSITAIAQATPDAFSNNILHLTVERDGVNGMPESLAAGRYTVHISSPVPAREDGIGVLFAVLPEGITPQQAFEDVQNADPFPEWFHQAHFGGGVNLQYNASQASGVIDLSPGSWIVTSLGARTPGVTFEVTGEFPSDSPVPDVHASIELDEMSITMKPAELPPGDIVIEVCNTGDQIHHLSFVRVPGNTTRENVQALWDSYLGGTPDANALSEDDTTEIAYFAEISPGVCQWGELMLKPGTYVLSCFVGDPNMGGMPHAFMGMWDLIVIP